VTLAVALRLHSVTHGNPVTIHAVIGSRGAPDILMGTLVPIVPVVLVAAGLLVDMSLLLWIAVLERPPGLAVAALVAGTGAVMILLGYVTGRASWDGPALSWHDTVVALAGAASTVFMAEWAQKVGPPRAGWPMKVLLAALMFAFPASALIALLDDEPWLPAERITATGSVDVVGYVIEEQDDELLVMRESDRLIQRVPAKARRTFCTLDESPTRSQPTYESCGR
jgi:hypothetical protein